MADPRAGQPADRKDLVDVAKLVTAYYVVHPDPADPAQRVAFGTSGHRGSAFSATFNDDHIPATTQAICEFRAAAASTARCSWARHARAVRAGLRHRAGGAGRQRRARCWWTAATGTRRPRRCPGRSWSTTPGPTAGWPTGSWSRRRTTRPRTAASSTTRPTAARRHRRSPRRSRTGPTTCWPAGCAGPPDPLRPGGRRRSTGTSTFSDGTCPELPAVVDLDAIRAAGPDRRRPARRGQRRLLGRDRRAVRPGPDRGQPGSRRDVPVHDPGLGRQDPDGLLLAVRDGVSLIGRRDEFTIATGNDTDSDRHGIVTPHGRAAQPEPLPGRRDRLPLPPPGRLAGRRRRRQDHGQLVDHRPGGRGGGAAR